MATNNNIYEKYSDEQLRLMLAIGMHDDNEKAANKFMHFVKKVWPEFIDGYRKMRNLMNDEEYRKIFKDVHLRADSKASGRWETNYGGEYFGAGIGGAITGRGADLLIIDDPHSEQSITDTSFDNAFDWYVSGPRQRLQPGGAIVVVMTRWSERDLTGRLIRQQAEVKADQWEVIEFPAILPSGKPIWPEYWKKEELEKIQANLPVMSWEAQYQQKPTSEEGAIIKRDWWKTWKRDDQKQ